MSIKYYLYLSESKVDMLFPQIPRAFLSGLSGELKVSLGVVSTTLKQGADSETKFAKLSTVIRYLEEHHAVGTVDQPEEYFSGTMQMKWGPYNEQFDKPSPLVYFGGESPETIVGLGGSAKHVVGATGPSHAHSHSATPYMVARLYEGLEMPLLQDDQARLTMTKKHFGTDESRNIAMAVDLATSQMHGEPQSVEFVARRLAHFKKGEHKAWRTDMNVLLGTPLYVASVE
jgi:hypothetical protein